jgi:hypothetical protein
MHLYSLFQSYCGSQPKHSTATLKSTGRSYERLSFSTLSSPIFTELHSLFYLKGIKVVPAGIGDLITARSLAYWAMDDGKKGKGGSSISVLFDYFTIGEVKLICSVLKENLTLENSIHKHGAHHRIYIRARSMERVRTLVTPYFHESSFIIFRSLAIISDL